MKAKSINKRITVSLPSDVFNSLPSWGRVNWLREAIAEKLQRENRLVLSSAESKAVDRLAKPIKEDEWVTMGTLDEEFDLEQVNRAIKLRGYTR
ncbi:MAG: hypothetical protein DCF20_07875 [Pseudanabaena sp.]|nr:MAG: hypothetical protein DCF20_07875 [Pseudanabaena sp.]